MDDVVWIPSTIQVKGKQYGMPFQWNYWTRVINKTLFRQAGVPLPTEKTTWPQLLDALQKISQPEQDVYGLETGTSALALVPHPLGVRRRGDLAPTRRRPCSTSRRSIEGLQFYADLMHRQRVATPMDEKGNMALRARFASGNVAVAHANAPGRGLDGQIGGQVRVGRDVPPARPETGKRSVFVSEQPNIVTTSGGRSRPPRAGGAPVAWAARQDGPGAAPGHRHQLLAHIQGGAEQPQVPRRPAGRASRPWWT